MSSDEEAVLVSELVKKSRKSAATSAKSPESKTRDILAAVPGAVPSPSRVSNQIELATSRLVRRARSASTSLQLHQVTTRVPIIRRAISNVVSVDGIVSGVELLLLFNKLFPRTYPVLSLSSPLTFSYTFLDFHPRPFCIHSMVRQSFSQIFSIFFQPRDSGSHSSLGSLSPLPFPSHLPTPSICPQHQPLVVVKLTTT